MTAALLDRAWSDERRAKKREKYARNYSTDHAGRAQSIRIPDDITVLTRDPYPCKCCGVRGDVPCAHRPWVEGAA